MLKKANIKLNTWKEVNPLTSCTKQWRIQAAPLLFRPNEARRAEKKIFWDSPPCHFISGSGWPGPPLSGGLDPPLQKRMALVFLLPRLTYGNSWFPPLRRWRTRTIRVRWWNFALYVFPLSLLFCRFLSSDTVQLDSFFTKICLQLVRVCL